MPAFHHRALITRLEALERRDIDRLMVFMPPGSAKSTYASVEFPPWYLGRRPTEGVIAASHTQELAEDFGRKVRNIVATPDYERLWGHSVASDNAAAGRWHTTKSGHYYAVGVGGSVTGRRADLGLIDDPVKGREAADSEREREKVWNWYLTDFLTRLKPNGIQLVIMTRWNEDDLAGRILNREGGRWEVFELGMEAHPGDPLGRSPGERLWPEYFTVEMIERAKLDPRSYQALYQQRPAPDEGLFFKREWFKWYSEAPKGLNKYLTSDFGVTEGGGDATEIGVHGVSPSGDLYLCLDGWGGNTSSDRWIDEGLTLTLRHKPLCEFHEAGVIRRAVEPFLTRRRTERKAHSRVEWIPPIGDKVARARSLQAMAASGRVYLPDNEYGHRVLADLLKFPASPDDHTVDMCGLMARVIDEAHPGIAPAGDAKVVRPDRWAKAFQDKGDGSWKTG